MFTSEYGVYVEAFERGLPRLSHQDDMDEQVRGDGLTTRSSQNLLRRGVERYIQHEAQAWQDAFFPTDEAVETYTEAVGRTPAQHRTDQYMAIYDDQEDKRAITTSDLDGFMEARSWQREKRADVINNFLYQEWLDQLGERDPIITYPVYALFTGIRAVVELVADRPAASPFTSIDRESVLLFKGLLDYDPSDYDWFIKTALVYIPGILDAAQQILVRYSDLVRVEQEINQVEESNTPLPDDPDGRALAGRYEIPEDLRVEQAVQAFQADEGSADEVAKKYRLGQKRFRAILRERGLMRPVGGDRRGKKGI